MAARKKKLLDWTTLTPRPRKSKIHIPPVDDKSVPPAERQARGEEWIDELGYTLDGIYDRL